MKSTIHRQQQALGLFPGDALPSLKCSLFQHVLVLGNVVFFVFGKRNAENVINCPAVHLTEPFTEF